jgi:DNA segregation ATPase FtsK/SpoIIIE, S-DNA-T family
MARVQELEAANQRLQDEIGEATDRLRRLVALARLSNESYTSAQADRLTDNLVSVQSAAATTFPLEQRPWDDDRWRSWQPAVGQLPREIIAGEMSEQRSGSRLGVPLCVGLIGSGRPIVLQSQGEHAAATAVHAMQSLVVRTSVLLPQQTRYTLLDPGGHGMAFPMARYLARVEPSTGDVRRDLDAVTLEIQRIIQTYLDAATPSFDLIPDELRLSEAFHFVFAANFPQGYDMRAAEALQSIARSGPAAGVYLILHHNFDVQSPTDISRYLVENPFILDVGNCASSIGSTATTVSFDAAPSAELQQLLLERIKRAPPIDRPVGWDDLDQLPASEWWTADATDRIRAPIGRHGANQELSIYFGVDERDQRPCAHGVLAAMTGAGKTGLFHTYIASLVTRYSPDELRLFLLDGKDGVSFHAYRHLPHADVVSLRTRPELARSVLTEMLDEMERRNELFKRHRVEHFTGYRALGSPDGPLPRILLVADEFQLLFEDDRDQDAANALRRLSEQSRSAGIHLLLGSQHFAPANMTHRNLVFANLHLRMAMQLVDSDINSTTDFGPNGRRLISATCDRPGRVVFNDRAGNDNENVAAKVAVLAPERQHDIIAAVRALWTEPSHQVVFDGDRQPDLVDNPLLNRLLDRGAWSDHAALERLARSPLAAGGLGWPDWLAAERPVALFLGQSFNVRGHAAVVMRRRQHEHLLVVGEHHSERVALLAAALTSACMQADPSSLRIRISDRSIPGTAWSVTLGQFTDLARGTGFDVERTTDEEGTGALIVALLAETRRRRELPEGDRLGEPALLAAFAEPDRTTALQRLAGNYGYEDAPLVGQLQQVLDQGPGVGVHVLAGFATRGSAAAVMSDKRLQTAFRHKVAMQMSEDDSFVMVRSPKASKLQPDGPRPVAALLFDAQSDRATKFKPYTIAEQGTAIVSDGEDVEIDNGPLDVQLRAIFDRIGGWVRA